MSQKYKGKGFVQLTGRNNMSYGSILGGSQNTITLTGAHGSMTAGQIFSLDSISPSQHHSIKKFEMYETPVDVLQLSCALQRMRENKEYGHKILDRRVVESVNNIDQSKAASIRDYYSKKIMFGKLNEKLYMSSFREDMNKFIHSDGLHFKESDIGMICYLPTFYDYDIQVDEVKAEVVINQQFREMDKNGSPRMLGVTANLTPLKKIIRKNRNTERIQYWLKDDKLNSAVLIQLMKDNPLLHIWDHYFTTQPMLKVEGTFGRTHHDDFEYFSTTNWKLKMD